MNEKLAMLLADEDNIDNISSLKLEILFDKNNVLSEQQNVLRLIAPETHQKRIALLKITAPKIVATRVPLNLVATIDISSSMRGEKLDIAKDSLCNLIDKLGPDDKLSIISFESLIKRVYPGQFMTGSNKKAALMAVKNLQSRGWTNFSGAVLESMSVMKEDEGKSGSISRILFFTDGEPTEGIIEQVPLLELVEKMSTPNVSITTFGYGDRYNADILTGISKICQGNHYYVEDIEKCSEMFNVELGGLLTLYAQNLQVEISTPKDITYTFLDDAYRREDKKLFLSDIIGDETRYILVELGIPFGLPLGKRNVVSFDISYDNLKEVSRETCGVSGHLSVVSTLSDNRINTEVQDQLNILSVLNAMKHAKKLAEHDQKQAASYLEHTIDTLDYTLPSSIFTADDLSLLHDTYRSGTDASRRSAATIYGYGTRRYTGITPAFENLNRTEILDEI